MRLRHTALLAFPLLVAALAPSPAVAAWVDANPLLNGAFELHAPLVASSLAAAGLGGPQGIGHQVLGCTGAADLVWRIDCEGEPVDLQTGVGAITEDPGSEIAAWRGGPTEGDVAYVDASQSSFFHAANWASFPRGTVVFGDAGGEPDREAAIRAENFMLYQSWNSVAPYSAIRFGHVLAVTFRLESGAPSGDVVVSLDAFPHETAADVPLVSTNYQLVVPASAWTLADGAWRADPTDGFLAGPYYGSYLPLPSDVAAQPAAPDWQGANSEERRDILDRYRAVQLTLWDFAAGSVVDDVALEVATQI